MPLVEAVGIWKAFPGVQALRGASFQGSAGRIHGLVGENGAGKSTLMRIVAGVYQPDRGELLVEGQSVRIPHPVAAHRLGIGMVYQDTRLAPDLDAAHNVWLGHEPSKVLDLIAGDRMYSATERLLENFDLSIDLTAPVRELSAAQRQAVEIAKALSLDARVLILDEPTSALNAREVENLFRVLRDLRQQGRCVVFVSHRLAEVITVTDTVTVMKDGEVVATVPTEEATQRDLVRMMVGREVHVVFPPRSTAPGEPVLEIDRLVAPGLFEDVSFTVRRGEIVGLGGIAENGQREIARALFGLVPTSSGSIRVNGQPVHVGSPVQALSDGIVYVSDDRRAEALMLPLTVRENVAAPSLHRRATFGFVRTAEERRVVRQVVDDYQIRTPSIETPVEGLSGGNQQKAAIGRWPLMNPLVLVLDEPTKGVDVASKLELYERIRRLADEGAAVLLLSSDLIELIGLCDRIVVVSDGRLVRDVSADEATEETVIGAAVSATNGGRHSGALAADAGRAQTRFARRLAYWRSPILLAGMLVLGAALAAALSPYFLTPENLGNVALQATPLALVAIGQMLVLLVRGIDLSIGATMSLTVTVASHVIGPSSLIPMPIGILICLAVGCLIGLLNGWMIRYLKVPDLIVTLASLFMVSGLALIVRPSPSGSILPDFMGAVTYAVGPVPVAAVLVLCTYLLLEAWLQGSLHGNRLYATGSSPEAAFIAGIDVDRIRVGAYVVSGFCAALGGLVLAARMGTGDPQAGTSFTLASVTAVVVGGVSIAGGRGTLLGVLMGAMLVIGLQNVLNLVHVSAYWQYVWIGVLTLLGVLTYSANWSRVAVLWRGRSSGRGR